MSLHQITKLYEVACIETKIHAEINHDLCAIGNDIELLTRYLDGLKGLLTQVRQGGRVELPKETMNRREIKEN